MVVVLVLRLEGQVLGMKVRVGRRCEDAARLPCKNRSGSSFSRTQRGANVNLNFLAFSVGREGRVILPSSQPQAIERATVI